MFLNLTIRLLKQCMVRDWNFFNIFTPGEEKT